MKKKMVLALAAALLVFSLAACSQNAADDETVTTTEAATTETTAEETTVETTTVSSPQETDADGNLVFNNVTYALSEYWSFNSETGGTRIYTNSDASETFAIFVQNETAYTADDMISAYEASVAAVYGGNYTEETVEINGLEWNVYHYSSDNALSAAVCVDIYLYSDGSNTIYIENAWSSATTVSGNMQDVLSSIVIK